MERNALWDRLASEDSVSLSDEQHRLLGAYLDRLIEANASINLTRIVDRTDAEVRHVGDALTLLRFLPRAEARSPKGNHLALVDVGTGGGVPGVPLAIARPDLHVTLVDSTKKKLDAVMGIVRPLGIENVTSVHARAESLQLKFDVVVARAVAELDTLVQWCVPLLHDRSTMLAMKGPRAEQELKDARRTLARLRLSAALHPLDIPELPGHAVIRIKRT